MMLEVAPVGIFAIIPKVGDLVDAVAATTTAYSVLVCVEAFLSTILSVGVLR